MSFKKILGAVFLLLALFSVGFFLFAPSDVKAQTMAELQAQIRELERQLRELQKQQTSTTTNTSNVSNNYYEFTRDLTLEMEGEDVRILQVFLNARAFYVESPGSGLAGSPGNETTYFGEKTRLALASFQAFHGIDPAVGYFGEITRTKVNAIISTEGVIPGASSGTTTTTTTTTTGTTTSGDTTSTTQTTTSTDTTSTAPSTTSTGTTSTQTTTSSTTSTSGSTTQTITTYSYQFNENLSRGSASEEVRMLQRYLNSRNFFVSTSGDGSPGNETIFFGPSTESALRSFQISRGIGPRSQQGNFGPQTRRVVNPDILANGLTYTVIGTPPDDGGGTPLPPTPTPAPTVSLSASPSSITSGSSATLTWSSTNATSCSASGAWSGSKATSGSQSFTLTDASSSYYLITCQGEGGTDTDSVTVTVTDTDTPPTTEAPTVSLSASQSSITNGDSVTLTWSSTNASFCTASNTAGLNVWGGSKATAGSDTFSPTSSSTYTLNCSNGAEVSASASVAVNVLLSGGPIVNNQYLFFNLFEEIGEGGEDVRVIQMMLNDRGFTVSDSGAGSPGNETTYFGQKTKDALKRLQDFYALDLRVMGSTFEGWFDAGTLDLFTILVEQDGVIVENKTPSLSVNFSPPNVEKGQNTTLLWSSGRTNSCTASGAWSGSKGHAGSLPLTPQSPATYTLSCVGWDGSTITRSATINPTEPTPDSPTVSLSASQSSITNGDSVTLTWSSTNASFCTASNTAGLNVWGGSKATAGSDTFSPTSSSTYTLNCSNGAGGSATANTSVSVTTTQTPVPTISNTLRLYEFEDNITDGQASDTSGNNQHGTASGSSIPTRVTDEAIGNYSYSFDGNDHVNIGDFDIYGNKMSISAWIKPTAFPASKNTQIVSKAIGGTTPNNHQWMLGTRGASNGTALAFGVKSSGATTMLIPSSNSSMLLDLNTWTHVAATYDGSTMKLYKNGVLIGSTNKFGDINLAPFPVYIGNQPVSLDQGWQGNLDHVGIYSKALSTTEINALVAAGPETSTPIPPPTETPAPTVSLSAIPNNFTGSGTTSLIWTSTNATSCTASNTAGSTVWSGTKATFGSQSFTVSSSSTYTLTCTGAGGSDSANASVTVTTVETPAPTVSLSASQSSITNGDSVTLTWSSTNASFCTASNTAGLNVWGGSKATAGSDTFSPSSSSTYTLNCSNGAGGSDSANASVSVTSTPLPPPPTGSTRARMGTNLDQPKDWSNALISTNLMWQAREWISGTQYNPNDGRAIQTDINGWPTSLASGQVARTVISTNRNHQPAGTYTVRWKGSGTVGIKDDWNNVQAKSSNSSPFTFTLPQINGQMVLVVEITSTTPGNHVRDIEVLVPGATTSTWYQPFLRSLQGYDTLRFMDWARVNNSSGYTSPTPPEYFTLAAENNRGNIGASPARMAQLSNAVGANMWFTVHDQASPAAIRQAAEMIRDHLDSDLKVYVEWSNELWNFGFWQAGRTLSGGKNMFPNIDQYSAQTRYQGVKSEEMFGIFESVLGDNRVLNVIASQADGGLWHTQNNIHPYAPSAEVIATAPYYDPTYIPLYSKVSNVLAQWNNYAAQKGLQHATYEGGQHYLGAEAESYNRTEQAYNDYKYYFQLWENANNAVPNTDAGLFVHFAHIGHGDFRHGSWASFERFDNSNIGFNHPKFRAIRETMSRWGQSPMTGGF